MTAGPLGEMRGSMRCLHSPLFDKGFIFGVLACALFMGALASLSPGWLLAVVSVDMWLFANPHIMATFTRIASSQSEIRRYWFLNFFLPLIVCAVVVMVALAYEAAGLITMYFIWQGYHVARQSYGIARSFGYIDPVGFFPDRLAEALIYLLPLWGLLNRCAESHQFFLGSPISLPAADPHLVDAAAVVTLSCGMGWLLRQCRCLISGRINSGHAWFVVSHCCISAVAYLWTDDITVGWVFLNIWHNVQYLLFVWLQNVRRERHMQVAVADADPGHVTGSARLVGAGWNWTRYLLLCLGGGTLLYGAIDMLGRQLLWLGLPTLLIAHFTVNFHHYLVDSVIWRRRKTCRVAQV